MAGQPARKPPKAEGGTSDSVVPFLDGKNAEQNGAAAIPDLVARWVDALEIIALQKLEIRKLRDEATGHDIDPLVLQQVATITGQFPQDGGKEYTEKFLQYVQALGIEPAGSLAELDAEIIALGEDDQPTIDSATAADYSAPNDLALRPLHMRINWRLVFRLSMALGLTWLALAFI